MQLNGNVDESEGYGAGPDRTGHGRFTSNDFNSTDADTAEVPVSRNL